jgi:hypothetical protein
MDNSTGTTVAPLKKKNSWFDKIETVEDCLSVIKDVSYGFFFVAFLQGVIGFALGANLWFDFAVYIILASILLKFKSRVAAVLLLLVTGLALVVTFLNRISPDPSLASGGTNIFLAIIIVWASVRAVQATFKLNKLSKV